MEINVKKPKWLTQTDVFNQRGEVLGVKGLQSAIGEPSCLPFIEMKQAIGDRVAAWRKGPATHEYFSCGLN
jgi:hypothetical protein